MSGPSLSLGHRVVADMARLAAGDVRGMLRVGRPGESRPNVAAFVRDAVGAPAEGLRGMQLGSVTVVVDGVGG